MIKGRRISTKNAKIWKYVAPDKKLLFINFYYGNNVDLTAFILINNNKLSLTSC